jgi:hypothetical protein
LIKIQNSILTKQGYVLQTDDNIFTTDENQDLLTSLESLIEFFKEKKENINSPSIPISLFSNKKLGVLEVIVKVLKENYLLNYSRIAYLLNRDVRTIWTVYKMSSKKNNEKFSLQMEGILIPSEIFSDRKLSPLEALTIYLKEKKELSIKKIAKLLSKEYRVVWVSYNHGIKKKDNKGNINEVE